MAATPAPIARQKAAIRVREHKLRHAEAMRPLIEQLVTESGYSIRAVQGYLNGAGIRPRRGERWSHRSTTRLLELLGLHTVKPKLCATADQIDAAPSAA